MPKAKPRFGPRNHNAMEELFVSEHGKYVFSVVVHSDDLAVVNCLRALSQYSQKTGNNRIPWGGTKDSDWRKDDHQVTFHFSSEEYRDEFKAQVRRLLPHDCCTFLIERDDDPAQRVSR